MIKIIRIVYIYVNNIHKLNIKKIKYKEKDKDKYKNKDKVKYKDREINKIKIYLYYMLIIYNLDIKIH